MNYFVSIENTPYYQWQIELLLESFNFHKIEDKLLIALAKSDSPAQPHFCRNLFKHERIYGHENIGMSRGYKKLNELYSLYWALQFNIIKQPLVYMEADMVLYKPVSTSYISKDFYEVIFAADPFFTIDMVAEQIGPFWQWLNKTKKDFEERWLVGSLMVFNNIPNELFQRVIGITELLCLKQLLHGRKEIWKYTDKVAWAINFADYVGTISIKGDYGLAMTMLDGYEANFIHYEHGLPPVFNKRMFQYEPPNYVSFGDPFKILAENAPTPASHFISQLAQNKNQGV